MTTPSRSQFFAAFFWGGGSGDTSTMEVSADRRDAPGGMPGRARRAGPRHTEVVTAYYTAMLTFSLPAGVSLGDWYTRYGQLHYADADGVWRVVDAEETALSDVSDFKHADAHEVEVVVGHDLVDHLWSLVRRHVVLWRTARYWRRAVSRGA